MPSVHEVSSTPYARLPAPSTSVTKNGSAVADIENSASAATAPQSVIARSRSRTRKAIPSRARTRSSMLVGAFRLAAGA